MGIDEVANGWCLRRWHSEEDGHGGYLATGQWAVWIDDND